MAIATLRETELARGLAEKFGGEITACWNRPDLNRIEFVELQGVRDVDTRVLCSLLETNYREQGFRVVSTDIDMGLVLQDEQGVESRLCYTCYRDFLTVSRDKDEK